MRASHTLIVLFTAFIQNALKDIERTSNSNNHSYKSNRCGGFSGSLSISDNIAYISENLNRYRLHFPLGKLSSIQMQEYTMGQ
jgi:hypothetical protein